MVNKNVLDTVSVKYLYAQHLVEKMACMQTALVESGYEELVISSGEMKKQFQDDMFYPFKSNPYFREWVPLSKRDGSFLHISASSNKLYLYLRCSEDIWHTTPQNLPTGFENNFQIIEYDSIDEVRAQLSFENGTLAFIGESDLLNIAIEHRNPQTILNHIDYHRRFKTPYEQQCVREANRLAAPAHRSAYDEFMNGGSELEICSAYLSACGNSENDMPYSIIAGLNEHAAVLHHVRLDNHRPKQLRSLLIDAGVEVRGYASDITRSYAYDVNSEFAEMIQLFDCKQQELVSAGALGKSPLDLQVMSHQKIAEVLICFGLINISVDEAVATRLTNVFYPHGLGHHLGCNVHDKGGQMISPQGEIIPVPSEYPTMRNTVAMVANQVYTVEPGLYFIPALLNKLRGTPAERHVRWNRIAAFLPYGGIRIEDNIILHGNGRLENLTRDAFEEIF